MGVTAVEVMGATSKRTRWNSSKAVTTATVAGKDACVSSSCKCPSHWIDANSEEQTKQIDNTITELRRELVDQAT